LRRFKSGTGRRGDNRRPEPEGLLFAKELDELDSDLNTYLQKLLVGKLPPFLYHYTTWAGFEGIARSQRFWATAHRCTSDPGEITSADSEIVELAKQLERETTGLWESEAIKRFITDYQDERLSRQGTIYMACFSAARDRGSQWKSFADEGRGVCLGLRVLYDEVGIKGPPEVVTVSVYYHVEEWRTSLLHGFREAITRYGQFARKDAARYRRAFGWAVAALFRLAGTAALRAKLPKFETEAEWRSLAYVRNEFRGEITVKTRGQGVEYIEIPIREQGPIVFEEILLGPRQVSNSAAERAKTILLEAGYDAPSLPPIVLSAAELD
jgi:hypothetical protein